MSSRRSLPDGYRLLPENLQRDQVRPRDRSRLLLLSPDKPPELLDLQRDDPAFPLPGIASSANVLGWFSPNFLCQWNGTNQILVREGRGEEFIAWAAIALESGIRPIGIAYNPASQLLAWTEGANTAVIFLARWSGAPV